MLQKLDICGHYLFFINSNLKIDYEHICKLYTRLTWNFLSSLSITTNIENDGKRKTKRNWKPKHLKKFWILTRKIFLLSVIEITYEHVFSIIHITNKCISIEMFHIETWKFIATFFRWGRRVIFSIKNVIEVQKLEIDGRKKNNKKNANVFDYHFIL